METKNKLRPVRNDGNDVESGKLSRATSSFTGIGKTKTHYKHVRRDLATTPKEDKVRGREDEIKFSTNNRLGKKVKVGKTIIVKAKDVKPPKKIVETKIPLKGKFPKPLGELLKDI